MACTALLTAALLTVSALTFGATRVAANGTVVNGSGSTWVAIALDQWRADIALQGYTINYQSVGSSQGRTNFISYQSSTDFAASEIPFYASEMQALQQSPNPSYQYVPDVAGGTSLMYNLHAPDGSRITTLRLDATTAGRIFTGGITSWQDPAIQTLNPGLQISETRVTPVTRSDGSGTSAQFSLYLASQAPSVWNPFAAQYSCPAPCSFWPPDAGSIQAQYSSGVAGFIANDTSGSGAIGYVEAGYAFQDGFPVARLENASGNFMPEAVDPHNGPLYFSKDVATALQHATLNPDLTQNLTGVYNAPEADAYPMSSYSYLITHTTGFDPAKGFVLGTWMIYIACAGQQEATPLGYSPMPPNLVQDMFDAVHRIPGAPPTPPLDPQHCPNPTVTGGAYHPPTTVGGASRGSGSREASPAGPGAAATAAAATDTGVPAAAADSGGLGAVTGATPVPTMSSAQRQAGFLAAERAASGFATQPSLPLLVAAAIVLLVVFVPVLTWRRRRAR